jgi:hypothetical protein
VAAEGDGHGLDGALQLLLDPVEIARDPRLVFRWQIQSLHGAELRLRLFQRIQPIEHDRVEQPDIGLRRAEQQHALQGGRGAGQVAALDLLDRVAGIEGGIVRIGENVRIADRRTVLGEQRPVRPAEPARAAVERAYLLAGLRRRILRLGRLRLRRGRPRKPHPQKSAHDQRAPDHASGAAGCLPRPSSVIETIPHAASWPATKSPATPCDRTQDVVCPVHPATFRARSTDAFPARSTHAPRGQHRARAGG